MTQMFRIVHVFRWSQFWKDYVGLARERDRQTDRDRKIYYLCLKTDDSQKYFIGTIK